MTILEADSVQTIRSLEHFIATNCNRALNNTLRLGEQSVEPLSDAHVKFLSLTTALQHEQAKNEVLTVCNAQLEAALAERADKRASQCSSKSTSLPARPCPTAWASGSATMTMCVSRVSRAKDRERVH